MANRPAGEPDAAAVRSFLSLMGRPGRLAELIRQLHELRVLEQFIPAMKRARGLLQFNEYHKYTVDRHCIRAVEAATQFENKDSPARERYRRLGDKLMLHLSLLIHDLGKGFEEDHSNVGKRIAAETAEVLGLDEEASETLQWLVHKHLIMHYAAFRHDLNDPQIIAKFADDVGTVDRLELLTLMSLADLTAVGPDVLTDWKEDLIEELYSRTKAYLETGKLPGQASPQVLRKRSEIAELLNTQSSPVLAYELLEQLPEPAILRPTAEFTSNLLCETVAPIVAGGPAPTICRGRFDASRGAIEYTIVMQPKAQPIGIFARATAALAACGLSILKAEITTLRDDWIWDTFLVEDQGSTANQDDHIRETGEKVARMMTSGKAIPTQRKLWSSTVQSEASRIKLQPAEVSFDNETMDCYTIILLFAYDRPGLLASISSVLASLKIVLHFAKIDTHLDQAVDVFYVSELDGTKITTDDRLHQIRTALLEAVDHSNE
jgi:[protein-PII] uridylyltransferase